MAKFEKDTVEVKGLDQLIKALKVKPPVARVGILGGKASEMHLAEGQSKGTTTNAEIGAIHEFGSTRMPQRSFLRIPVSENLEKEMKSGGLFDKDKLAQVIKTASLQPWMEQVALAAEACVQDAFDTGGNGKWPPWKTPGYENNTGLLLVDTGQLRRAITSEVK